MPSLSTRIKETFLSTFKSLYAMMPMMFAIIGLVGLFQVVVTPQMLQSLFSGSPLLDTIIGTLVGAVSVGQPFFSYIIGGELLNEGVSLHAVTAFILAWVTIGFIQIPMEWQIFGGRFTIIRNLFSFTFALFIAFATSVTMSILL
jgi:uncharacterized membrane protein YraQ (UPF0718 family)